jgi:hypothetical protein
MYLFLGRFEQLKPFWTCHTQFYYIIDKKKLKMEPKFKMASIVKKCDFPLAVTYLFLGRFEQLKPFWTCHTRLFYIIDKKKLKMEPKFKMASIVKECDFPLAVTYLFLGRFEQLKPFWTCHTQLFYIIDKKN